MYVSKDYSKDYISVFDVVDSVLRLINCQNRPSIVNVASGLNTAAKDIANILESKTDCEVLWHECTHDVEKFPVTNIDKISSVLSYNPRNVLSDMEEMINDYYSILSSGNEVV